MTRRVLLFDPLSGGHRAQYVAAIARSALQYPHLALAFALTGPVIQQVDRLMSAVPGREQIRFVEISPDIAGSIQPNNKDLLGGLRVLQHAEALAGELSIDHIFLMQADTFLPALFAKSLLSRGKHRFSGIYFRPTLHYGPLFGQALNFKERAFNALKSLFLRRILSSGLTERLLSLDPYFDDAHAGARGRAKITPLPDLVSPPTTAVRPHDVPSSWLARQHRFVLFGEIAERKGARQLIEAISMLPPEVATSSAFLICGEVAKPFAETFASAMSAYEVSGDRAGLAAISRFVSDEELWWLVGNSTAVLAPYQRHIGYSGVLCWAAAARKPILTQDFGVLGWEVRQQKLGLAVDTTRPSEICAALELICAGGDGLADPASQARFVEAHSERAFTSTVLEALGHD